MADHRDRDEDAPEAGTGQGASEPEFGSPEWLLQQLSGGRLSGEDAGAGSTSDAGAHAAESPSGEDAEVVSAPRRSNWVEPPTTTTPLPRVVPEAVGEPEPQAVPETGAEPDIASPTGAGPVSAPATVPESGAPFVWNLTPAVGTDPLVEPAGREPVPRDSAEVQPPPVNPEVPAVPANAEAPAAPVPPIFPPGVGPVVDTTAFAAPSFADSLRMPEPPSWEILLGGAEATVTPDLTSGATADEDEPSIPAVADEPGDVPSASPWNPFANPAAEQPDAFRPPQPLFVPVPAVLPTPVAEPTTSPPPPAEPRASLPPAAAPRPGASHGPDESHGLAALLGHFDGADDEPPASHSVIGDTTGVVIIPGEPVEPAPEVPAPEVPAPDVQETGYVPTIPGDPAPVIPSPLIPTPPSVSAPIPSAPEDTPTTKLDTHEIAALLNARTGDPQPEQNIPPAMSAPGVPPLEQAAFLMGALPSPATQALDAQSLAEMSDATAVLPTVTPNPVSAEDASAGASEPAEEPEPPTSADADDTPADDGLVALFGDAVVAEADVDATTALPALLTPDDATAQDAATTVLPAQDAATTVFTQAVPPFAPLGAPSSADAILFPELATQAMEPLPATQFPPETPLRPASAPSLASAADETAAPTAAFGSPAASAASATPGPFVPATTAFPLPALPAVPAGPNSPPAGPAGPTTPGGLGAFATNNRLLFWIAGGLAVVLVLIGLFALGTRLPALFGVGAPAPLASGTTTPSATPTPTPVPTVRAKPAVPQPAGTHPWDTLGGGECIAPYTTPWAESFTVVDCTTPHAAQLVYTNLFSADPAAPYPGVDALAQQINLLCTKSGIIDLSAAGAYPDLQLQGTYPATEQQWKDGERSYYCFANRAGGQPLTSSVAGPGPTG